MGQMLNKMVSLTLREVKTYNIERRAEKVISKEKPTPAPMYPSTVKELERLKEENISTEYIHKKDDKLDEYLKKVYVSSSDPAPPMERQMNPNRPLPVSRATDYGISYGYSESEEAMVPESKVSLKQALLFISNHQNDPKKYSNAFIASQHKLSLEDTNDILDHFKMFTVNVQKKEVDPESLSTYERIQQKVKHMTIYSTPEIIKELKSAYESTNEKPSGSDKLDDKNEKSAKNLENPVQKMHSKTLGKSNQDENINIDEYSKGEINLNHDETGGKGSKRKQTQENG